MTHGEMGGTGVRVSAPGMLSPSDTAVMADIHTLFSSGWSGGKSSAASPRAGRGACEKKCPQRIEIRRKLKEADAELSSKAPKPLLGAMRLARRIRG